MRRGRVFIYLALILIFSLVAVAVIWYRYLQPASPPSVAEASPTPVIDLVNVVVVTQRVPRGGILDETVLGMIPIQRELVIQGYFTDMASVVGRRARVDLEPNMILTSGMVVDTTEQLAATGSNAALLIPRGMVAISIPINRLSSVSYAIQPGDHVNVIVTMLLVDLDTEFQSELPNRTSAVLAAGPGVVLGSSLEGTTEKSQEASIAKASDTTKTGETVEAQVAPEMEKITGQTHVAGPSSIMGRTEIDPLLEQTFYVVPSESQRPRLLSQTLIQDVIVLGVGNFPLKPKEAQTSLTLPGQETPTVEATPEAISPEAQAVEQVSPPDVITLIVTPQDAVTLNYLMYSGAQLTLVLRGTGDDTRVQTEAATLDFLFKHYNMTVPVKLPYGLEPRVDDLALPSLPSDIKPTPVP
jgi:Flp pilus assembly protein CpaB